MNFGEKLFELRKAKNLSQEEVAEKLNVTRQTVSKWETNQSSPDFDKIMPLCELFEIGVEELITGNKPEKYQKEEGSKKEIDKVLTKEEVRRKTAEVVSISVFFYILSVALFIMAVAFFGVDPIIAITVFLGMIGFTTARLIRHKMSVPKFEETSEEKKEAEIIKQINGIVGAICATFYFIVSFATMAWHVTWIIFIIDGLICQIVRLYFMLKEEKVDGK